jgi:protein TonB
MIHAGSPSLFSLDLSSHLHTENSSLRRWLAGSFILHIVVALLALNLRFTPDIQQPFSSYEVSLVSLPATKATTPSRSKKAPSKPQEKPLPPLTTKMASERLSESLSGAAKSVVVPDKLVAQAQADAPPVVKTAPEQPSALESIKLLSEAPTLERVKPLAPAKPEKDPDAALKEPKKSTPAPPVAPKRKTTPPSKANVKDALKDIKSPPKAPELASVQPFAKTQEAETSPSTHEPLSQSLKEKMQSIQVPGPQKKPIRSPKKRTKKNTPITPPPTRTPRSTELAKTAPSPKKELPPVKPRERLSDSLKQVLESVKVPKLRDVTKPDLTRQRASKLPSSKPVIPPRDAAASKKFRTEIDQQLAKLTVPEVAPIESIRTRLQVQEAPSDSDESNQSGPASQSSRNTAGQNRYLALVQAHIDQQWVAPPVKAHEKNLQVVLKFRILRSGKVIDLDIAQGSGNSYYDAAALRAVQAASPLPPFPSDIRKFSFDVRYNFVLGEPSS